MILLNYKYSGHLQKQKLNSFFLSDCFFLDTRYAGLSIVTNVNSSTSYTLWCNQATFLLISGLLTSNFFVGKLSLLEAFFFNRLGTVGVYNFSSIFYDLLVNLNYSIFKNNNFIYSVTGLYASSIWLEREINELNFFFIRGLRDSRRLLTDYSTTKTPVLGEGTFTNFNELFGEIVYN